MSEPNDLTALADQLADRLMDRLLEKMLASAKLAAERAEMEERLAQARQRLSAFAPILAAIAAEKEAIEGRLAVANGPMKILLQQQVEALGGQENAVLLRAGIAAPSAQPVPALPERTEGSPKRNGVSKASNGARS